MCFFWIQHRGCFYGEVTFASFGMTVLHNVIGFCEPAQRITITKILNNCVCKIIITT